MQRLFQKFLKKILSPPVFLLWISLRFPFGISSRTQAIGSPEILPPIYWYFIQNCSCFSTKFYDKLIEEFLEGFATKMPEKISVTIFWGIFVGIPGKSLIKFLKKKMKIGLKASSYHPISLRHISLNFWKSFLNKIMIFCQ